MSDGRTLRVRLISSYERRPLDIVDKGAQVWVSWLWSVASGPRWVMKAHRFFEAAASAGRVLAMALSRRRARLQRAAKLVQEFFLAVSGGGDGGSDGSPLGVCVCKRQYQKGEISVSSLFLPARRRAALIPRETDSTDLPSPLPVVSIFPLFFSPCRPPVVTECTPNPAN